ncbi:MAG: hypothetical protein K6G61_05580 [Solobacterium sp.]|nr:hypothetical protein [Solobacterium sp.]
MEYMDVNGIPYRIIKLLGHGKGGYSYLCEKDSVQYVLKQIHHEPCDYYTFGNKIEAERRDYERLRDAGIRIPVMFAIDIERERILKEYIEGDVISDLIRENKDVSPYIPQLEAMAQQAYAKGMNIDYYPTNFVIRDGLLYYIDYECNAYSEEWNLENWGMQYWKEGKL